MLWIFIISVLIVVNLLLLKFSCNECDAPKTVRKPKFNMPEKNDIIIRPIMADK